MGKKKSSGEELRYVRDHYALHADRCVLARLLRYHSEYAVPEHLHSLAEVRASAYYRTLEESGEET